MKSNTTHNPPITPLENLGDGTTYYNFNVTEKTVEEEDSDPYISYDYDQVRITNPVTLEKINVALQAEGYPIIEEN